MLFVSLIDWSQSTGKPAAVRAFARMAVRERRW
jgi:hypothetical protein